MAKAVHVYGFAGADYASHMKLVDIEVPEPGPGQVLVQIYLRPVNPTDILFCSGAYGPDFPLPRVPGSEGRLLYAISAQIRRVSDKCTVHVYCRDASWSVPLEIAALLEGQEDSVCVQVLQGL